MSSSCRSRSRPNRRGDRDTAESDRPGCAPTDSETWQAEALDPSDLAEIVRDAIEDRFAYGTYRAVLAQEERLRRELLNRLG
jgi:hypothetical protein